MKSRNMQATRLQAVVAGTLGYSSGLEDKQRTKLFAEAAALIKSVNDGGADHDLKGIILVTMQGIEAFQGVMSSVEKEQVKMARQLPVAKWVEDPKQRGFGMLSLATIVGECGDLSNYSGPAKVWRRMGLFAYTKDGETLMGSTWKSRAGGKRGTKLSSEEWEDFGYSPRRRSIAFLIGENIVKSGQGTYYRERYETKKAELKQLHPNYSDMRCHRHGMLVATKTLLKHLWMDWNDYPPMPKY
jgi:hypothetical protein